jgi:uncharacterized protein (TIGR00369 family)
MRLARAEDGFARVELPFRPEFVGDSRRPALHGGLLSTLADATGGLAVWAGGDDSRARISTIDLRIDYLRPARLETLCAEARILRLGASVAAVDIRLFHLSDEGETIATGKAVYSVRPAKKD